MLLHSSQAIPARNEAGMADQRAIAMAKAMAAKQGYLLGGGGL
jgi:hypothetical protein